MKKKIFLFIFILLLFIITLNSCLDKTNNEKWKVIIDKKVRPDAAYAYFISDNFGFISTSGMIYYTDDAGRNWKRSDTKFGYNGLDVINSREGYVYSTFAVDGSKTGNDLYWKQIKPDYVCNEFGYVSFFSTQCGWLGTNSLKTKLRKTTDGGISWDEVELPDSMHAILALSLVNKSTGLILDSSLNIFKTVDGGITWEILPINVDKYDFSCTDAEPFRASMRFYNEAEGDIIIFKDKPLKKWCNLETSNGGNDWRFIDLPGDKGMVSLSRDGKYLSILGSRLYLLKNTLK